MARTRAADAVARVLQQSVFQEAQALRVNSIDFSHDGNRAVTAQAGGVVSLIDTVHGMYVWNGHAPAPDLEWPQLRATHMCLTLFSPDNPTRAQRVTRSGVFKDTGASQVCFTHAPHAVLFASNKTNDGTVSYYSFHDNRIIHRFSAHRKRWVSCPSRSSKRSADAALTECCAVSSRFVCHLLMIPSSRPGPTA